MNIIKELNISDKISDKSYKNEANTFAFLEEKTDMQLFKEHKEKPTYLQVIYKYHSHGFQTERLIPWKQPLNEN
jgi:hypothetical protein